MMIFFFLRFFGWISYFSNVRRNSKKEPCLDSNCLKSRHIQESDSLIDCSTVKKRTAEDQFHLGGERNFTFCPPPCDIPLPGLENVLENICTTEAGCSEKKRRINFQNTGKKRCTGVTKMMKLVSVPIFIIW